jgi:hypothetical protein
VVSGGWWEVGGGRWEVGGGRWEVGGGRWEVGGREAVIALTSGHCPLGTPWEEGRVGGIAPVAPLTVSTAPASWPGLRCHLPPHTT